MIPAPDGYQYGVRFDFDGSVAARWNGHTQRQRAQEYRDELTNRDTSPFIRSKRDTYTVVRRIPPDGEWEPVT